RQCFRPSQTCKPAGLRNLSAPSAEPDHRATTRPERNQNAKGRRKSESLCVDPMTDFWRSPTRTDTPSRDRSARRRLHEPTRLRFHGCECLVTWWRNFVLGALCFVLCSLYFVLGSDLD